MPPDGTAPSAGAGQLSPKALPRPSPQSVGQRAFAPGRDGVPPRAVPDLRPRAERLARLAAEIRAIEGRGPVLTVPDAPMEAAGGWRLGVPRIDRRLGPGGLATTALHEIKPADASACGGDWASQLTASLSFALALERCRRTGLQEGGDPISTALAPVLWCWPMALAQEIGGLNAAGLADLGLAPATLILAEPAKAADVLWAMEEGLKSGALGLVVGVLKELELTPARRLALAAAQHAIPCLAVTDARSAPAGATATRWRIGRAVSAPHPIAARLGSDAGPPGAPRYRVRLERSRGAGLAVPAADTILEWSHEAYRFRLAAAPADRADGRGRARQHSR